MVPVCADVKLAVRQLLRRARPQAGARTQRLLHHATRRAGLDVVKADYYSPIFDPATVAAEHWERPAPMPGLELDLDSQLEWIERDLLQYIREFRPPVEPQSDPAALHLDNPWYGPMDAHLLYAIIRHAAPRRVLELGSGYSTLVIRRALEGNEAQGEHHVVDPFPSQLLTSFSERVRVHRTSAASLPAEHFDELHAGDVLFVDTSHVVKPGSEVIRLVLEVLPALRAQVIVHFHDIFRPFEYPRIFYERFNVHWQEQYLLQAFLAYNPHFRVLCSNHALWRLRRERVLPLFEGLRDGMQPGGFWFRKV